MVNSVFISYTALCDLEFWRPYFGNGISRLFIEAPASQELFCINNIINRIRNGGVFMLLWLLSFVSFVVIAGLGYFLIIGIVKIINCCSLPRK